MNRTYLRPIQDAWSAIPAGPLTDVVPTTATELQRLEALLPLGSRFPEAVATYLLWGGERAGQLYRSVDFSTRMIRVHLESGLRGIQSMVARNGGTEALPADMLVINEHLGSSFTYLLLSDGENPPVYMWEEGGIRGLHDAVMETPTFVEWVLLRIANYRSLIRG